MGRYETMDMEWTESDARDNDRYKAWSDEELIDNEHFKGRDEIIDPDGRKKDHSRTREKEKHRTKDKEAESERFREHDRERDREHNSGKDKEKLKDRDRHKDRGRERDKEREREQDRDAVRDRDEDKEKLKGKDRERAKARESGRDKEKDVLLKERDREKGKEKHKSKSKEKDRDEDKGVERKKQQEDNYDAEKQKERTKDRVKDAEIDRDLEYAKERKEEREKDKEREREREKKDRDKLREKDRERERDREREKDRDKERMRDKERDKVRHKDNERIRDRDHDRESDRDKEREREKERLKTKDRESKDAGKIRKEVRDYDDVAKDKEKSNGRDHDENDQTELEGSRMSAVSLEERLTKVRDERLKGKTDPGNEIAAWVSKSRKLDEQKNVEREKAVRFAKILEEQDGVEDTESDDEEKAGHGGKDLAGLKVLHGLDKVMEGGAVVLTLKDQNILAGGDVNDEIDMLENIEIGEQISRNEAYKAAKKKPGIYEDKFQNDTNTAKSILPQYDDPFKEEGITLDEMGGVSEEAQKKLEEIRKKLQGGYMENRVEESLYQPGSSMSDYYTHDEMLQFKKPKKKKKLRKKDKLDVDALEADAIAAGLGVGDLGSRANINRRVSREEAEKMEAEQRKNAYEAAYNKAAEASRGLRGEKLSDAMQVDEDGDVVYGGDDEELYKSLEKARRAALKKQAENSGSGPQAVARLAVAANHPTGEAQNQLSDTQENKVIFTEMEEFVWSLQLDEDTQKPIVEDVFNEEDEGPGPVKQQDAAETIGGWTEVKELDTSQLKAEEEEEVVPDETIKEVSIGKGLASALQLLKERGTLKETVDWGGRNMDKKKSKLVGVRDNDGPKEILLDRLDEFGRVMTPKEAFRKLSHKFHGKGPGKMKQEKRMKQYQEELKLKQMNTGDTPLMSMEKMRDVQAKLRTPYIVLSGQIKPGQTSDPRSGFATVEKEPPGSLTPMLGDRKVEHFLGIKRKPEVGTMGPPKKPKS